MLKKGVNPVGRKPKISPGPSIEALRLAPHVPTNCPACVLYACVYFMHACDIMAPRAE